MSCFLGIDLGTSAVKIVLVDADQTLLAQASAPLVISRPRALWSEQAPEDWWQTVSKLLDHIKMQAPAALAAVRAIGLSGQMHGAVLLDVKNRPLRPAILWNDGRAHAQAAELAERHPALAGVVGVVPMPGLTAPKLMWVKQHEPDVSRSIRTVLSPKDYLRLHLSGERITDVSDAAGTWWLDQAQRSWSLDALDATGTELGLMPRLVEGCKAAGTLSNDLAHRWGMGADVTIAGGAGDAAAGAISLGAVSDGAAFVSLGTSGQLFVTTSSYRPAPETLLHAFCHALPDRWLQMAAMLNGAGCFSWVAALVGQNLATLMAEAEANFSGPGDLMFLPYLSGERTPHNDPHARGVFFGLTQQTDRVQLAVSVLEGVAFSFADALTCVETMGSKVSSAGLIGGGARSTLWPRILASVLNRSLILYRGAENGPAFGAARLARLSVTAEPVEAVCVSPPIAQIVAPDPNMTEQYQSRIARFRRLYTVLRREFQPT